MAERISVICRDGTVVHVMPVGDGMVSIQSQDDIRATLPDAQGMVTATITTRDGAGDHESQRCVFAGAVVSIEAHGSAVVVLETSCCSDAVLGVVADGAASIKEWITDMSNRKSIDSIDIRTSDTSSVNLPSMVARKKARVHASDASVIAVGCDARCNDLQKYADSGARIDFT